MYAILLKAAAVNFGIHWLCWAVDLVVKTQKYYDVPGTAVFPVLALLSLKWGNTFYIRQTINTGLVIIWGCRLVLYLVKRNMKYGADHRYTFIRKPAEFIVWSMQGVWVMSTMLPVLLLNGKKENPGLFKQDDLGWAIWIAGFILECVADHQKSTFRANPENEGKFIQHGLWSVCRHPNYLGEIMMWTGIYLSSSTVLSGYEHISIISPTLLAFLLIKVFGIPLLEESGAKRWGDDPYYKAYLATTARLIPCIW